MDAKLTIPAAALFSLLTLAGCNPELMEGKAYMGDEVFIIPLSLLDVAPFFCCCAVALAALAQCFIPALRRLYAACWRFPIDLLAIERQRTEKAQLLAGWTAWLGFCGGVSLLPLCPVLYADTFHIHMGGPMNLGYTIFAFIIYTCPLMLAGFVLTSLCYAWRWRQLMRSEKAAA